MRAIVFLGTLILFASCSGGDAPSISVRSGIDSGGFDQAVLPQDDFNAYVNGGWIRNTEIPGEDKRNKGGSVG